ncbi:putative Ig domain-containing protein, partial [Thermodesulfobacteriota bacterium]
MKVSVFFRASFVSIFVFFLIGIPFSFAGEVFPHDVFSSISTYGIDLNGYFDFGYVVKYQGHFKADETHTVSIRARAYEHDYPFVNDWFNDIYEYTYNIASEDIPTDGEYILYLYNGENLYTVNQFDESKSKFMWNDIGPLSLNDDYGSDLEVCASIYLNHNGDQEVYSYTDNSFFYPIDAEIKYTKTPLEKVDIWPKKVSLYSFNDQHIEKDAVTITNNRDVPITMQAHINEPFYIVGDTSFQIDSGQSFQLRIGYVPSEFGSDISILSLSLDEGVTSVEINGHIKSKPQISGGRYHTLSLKDDGTVLAWGGNYFGQLGDGTTEDRYFPTKVKGVGGIGYLNEIIKISNGAYYHSLALNSNGEVWAWGINYYGGLGDGTTEDRHTPVQVKGEGAVGFLTDVIDIANSCYCSIALKKDGTVWAWGENTYGNLGDGTTEDSHTPVQVKGEEGIGFLTDIVAIGGSGLHWLALRSDGTVWAWGFNSYGGLGDGTTTDHSTPVQVKGQGGVGYLSDVVDISITDGGAHSFAIKKDSTVWAWGGSNYNYGVLGDGTTANRYTPVQVKGEGGIGYLSNVIKVSGGSRSNLALKADGTVWAWGRNDYYQLGDGTKEDHYTPVQVKNEDGIGHLNDIVDIDAGGINSFAIKSTGQVLSWGFNDQGELGDGTIYTRSVPVKVKDENGVCWLDLDSPVNQAPLADAGPNQSVFEGTVVTLDGSNSYDPNGPIDQERYQWSQLSGTPITLDLTSPDKPTFTAPEVGISGESLGFKLTVSDECYSDTANVTINVINANKSPTIAGSPATLVNENTYYSFTPTATDDDVGDTLTYSITNKPLWADFNLITGALTGTPTNENVGTTDGIVITVSDNHQASVSLPAFDLSVINTNDPPSISGPPVTIANEGNIYSFTPTANDIDLGDSLLFSIINKPNWANFDTSTGELSGTPANIDVDIYQGVVITVTDGQLSTSLPAFDITVLNVNNPPTITGVPSTIISQNATYSFIPTANDIDFSDSLLFSIVNKPAWADFDPLTGELSGIATNADVGTYNGIEITVTDGQLSASLPAFDITILNVNDPPTISGVPSTIISKDTAYGFTPTANDIDLGDSLLFSIINKPAWAHFDPSTGELSGTPSSIDVGTYQGIVIAVTDGQLSASLPVFDISVIGLTLIDELPENSQLINSIKVDKYAEISFEGNVIVKTYNSIKGLAIGEDKTQTFSVPSSNYRYPSSDSASRIIFNFSEPISRITALLSDFDGETTLSAYNYNDILINKVNIQGSDPQNYIIQNVEQIWKVTITSTSGWLGNISYVLDTSLNEGLVAYYPFNGEAKDESGNGHDGIVNGATLANDRFGNPNSSYSFDGASNYINISSVPTFINDEEKSFFLWVYLPDGISGDGFGNIRSIIDSSPSGHWRSFYIGIEGTSYKPSVLLESTVAEGEPVTHDQWHHVGFVWAPNTPIKMYIDGNLSGQSENLSSWSSLTGSIYIGRQYSNPSGHYYEGKIDDIRIYNRALSEAEVQTLYQLSSSAVNIPGDLNADEIVDLTDAVIVLQILSGMNPSGATSLNITPDVDISGDGKLGIAEAIYILRVISQESVYDNDGDGYTEGQGDCNDADSDLNPGANDICQDGIDQ